MLAPVFNPFNGPAQLQACCGNGHFFRIQHEFRSEAAADLRRDYADLILVEIEESHQKAADFVCELCRCPKRQAVFISAVSRKCAAALDRVGPAAVLLEFKRDAMRRVVKSGGDITVRLPELDQ